MNMTYLYKGDKSKMLLCWWSRNEARLGDYDVRSNIEEEEKEEVENNEDWPNDLEHPGPELHLVSRGRRRREGGAADNLSPFPA